MALKIFSLKITAFNFLGFVTARWDFIMNFTIFVCVCVKDYKTGYHASPSQSTIQGQTLSQSEEDKAAGLQPPIQMEPHPPVQKKSSTNLRGQSPNQMHDTVESLIVRPGR